jgi:hypothetical protein
MSILVEEAAESVCSAYAEGGDVLRVVDRLGKGTEGSGVRDALVRPVAVVEGLELPQGVEQMLLVPDQGGGPAARGGRSAPSAQ